ncbi:interleukin-10 receptor subunit alpha-like isoform X2 [Hyla sarda]|nr:interleukin-10 receptor subunit alpha-like isoform X2 [Hyla sarda]
MTLEVKRVVFSSLDFSTMLHWSTTCDGQPTCKYELQYKVYGDSEWQKKRDCEKSKNFCNMTAEILKKEHVDEKIFARVRAKTNNNATSSWKISKEFQVLRETNISAPAVTVTPSSHTILVDITAPLLLYHIKYAGTDYQKKISFLIKLSSSSKLIKEDYTEKKIWNITNLAPGKYCISVNMKYGEITSSSSPNKCVEIKGVVLKEVIMGSILVLFASVVIVVILTIYLFLHRNVFHPKPPLPSNLILNNMKSKPTDYKSDVTFMVPPEFEGLEPSKYILASDKNVKEPSQNKRYVSTDTWRKDYVNCRQKDMDQNVLQNKIVELRNSTYVTKVFQIEHPNVCITSQARYTELDVSPHHKHFYKDEGYYKNFNKSRKLCPYPRPSCTNPVQNLNHVYKNDPQLGYSNTSGKEI